MAKNFEIAKEGEMSPVVSTLLLLVVGIMYIPTIVHMNEELHELEYAFTELSYFDEEEIESMKKQYTWLWNRYHGWIMILVILSAFFTLL